MARLKPEAGHSCPANLNLAGQECPAYITVFRNINTNLLGAVLSGWSTKFLDFAGLLVPRVLFVKDRCGV